MIDYVFLCKIIVRFFLVINRLLVLREQAALGVLEGALAQVPALIFYMSGLPVVVACLGVLKLIGSVCLRPFIDTDSVISRFGLISVIKLLCLVGKNAVRVTVPELGLRLCRTLVLVVQSVVLLLDSAACRCLRIFVYAQNSARVVNFLLRRLVGLRPVIQGGNILAVRLLLGLVRFISVLGGLRKAGYRNMILIRGISAFNSLVSF